MRPTDNARTFEQVYAAPREFVPEGPQNSDDLVDLLARRRRAAQRMLTSMTDAAAQRSDGAGAAGVSAIRRLAERSASGLRSCRDSGPARTAGARVGFRGGTRWAWARPPARWTGSGSRRADRAAAQTTRAHGSKTLDLESLAQHLVTRPR